MGDNNTDPSMEARFWKQKYQEQLQVINMLMSENSTMTTVLQTLAQQLTAQQQQQPDESNGSNVDEAVEAAAMN